MVQARMVQLLEWAMVGPQGTISDFASVRSVNASVGGVRGVMRSALAAAHPISLERVRGDRSEFGFGELMVLVVGEERNASCM